MKHGENIVDLMGGEIDRIEMKLRVSDAHMLVLFCTIFIDFISCSLLNRKNVRKLGTVILKYCRKKLLCQTEMLQIPKLIRLNYDVCIVHA